MALRAAPRTPQPKRATTTTSSRHPIPPTALLLLAHQNAQEVRAPLLRLPAVAVPTHRNCSRPNTPIPAPPLLHRHDRRSLPTSPDRGTPCHYPTMHPRYNTSRGQLIKDLCSTCVALEHSTSFYVHFHFCFITMEVVLFWLIRSSTKPLLVTQ